MGVAAPAVAALAHNDALAVVREVGELVEALLRLGVEFVDHGPQGDRQQNVRAVGPVALRALAVRAATRLEMVLEAVVDERRPLGVRDDHDVAAVAAVAAVGAAFGDMRLAPERHAARAAVAAFHVDAP